MAVLRCSTFKEIDRHFRVICYIERLKDCSVCMPGELTRGGWSLVISVAILLNCVDCFLQLLRLGRGVVMCPSCRHEYGYECDGRVRPVYIKYSLNSSN